MGWYSLYNWFIQFRKTPYSNMASWYKRYLYNTWFESLSEEEQRKELKRVREEERKRKEEVKRLFAMLNGMRDGLNRVTRQNRRYDYSYSDMLSDCFDW